MSKLDQAFYLMEGNSTRLSIDGWTYVPITSQRIARKECAKRQVSWRYVKKLWARGDTHITIKGDNAGGFKVPSMTVNSKEGCYKKALLIGG